MLNHIDIIGRVIREPELRTTPNGVNTASFAVSVERDSSQRDEKGYRLTDIFNIVTWRQTAEYSSKYIHKGDNVGVSGRLQIRSYTDRDGNKRDSIEIVADNVYSVGNRRDNGDVWDGGYTGSNNGGSSYGGNQGGSNFDSGYGRGNAPARGGFSDLNDDDGELPF